MRMLPRLCALAVCLLLCSAVAAETVYKYRRADGRTVYSNRPLPRLELIETFEYKFADPAAASPVESRSAAEGEARIKKHLGALQAAWTEVQDATRALAAAEARLRAGVEPQGGDRAGVDSGTAPPGAGGIPAPASPSVGGSMSGRRGRASPEYVARMEALEGDVRTARERLDTALRNYNQLR